MSTILFKFPRPPSDDPNQTPDDKDRKDWQRKWFSAKDILTDYVQPDSTLSLDDTINQVVRFWNEESSGLAVAVLMVPIALAEQIPYDHPSQKKLAEFMLSLHESGSWIPEHISDEEREREKRSMWDTFCFYLWDNDWRPEEKVDEDDRPMAYANFCAFVANLIFPESESMRFYYMLAKVALEDATSLEPTLRTEVRNARVIGAAQYILFQVQTIFEEVLKQRKRDAEAVHKNGWFSRLTRRERKPERKPEEEFYWSEWKAWRTMFRAASGDEAYGKECREIAQRAADLMALQEKIEANRSAGS